MARLENDPWYSIDFKTAHFITECCGFIQKPFDLWDMETRQYYHQKSDVSFNFKTGMTDEISFLIQPYYQDKSITLDELKQKLAEMGVLENEQPGKVALT